MMMGQSMVHRASQFGGFLAGSEAFNWLPPLFGGFDASYENIIMIKVLVHQ